MNREHSENEQPKIQFLRRQCPCQSAARPLCHLTAGGDGTESLEVQLNRSPAFQFYPDKWQSHTRRLSDSAYRVFHELLCWMWQHSENHCSIQASPEAVACAVAMPLECVRIALAEIQNPFSPLLKVEGDKWVSNGLRKESAKQGQRRDKAKASADARWRGANAMQTHKPPDVDAQAEQCFPSPSPFPSSLHERERAFAERPSLKEVLDRAQFIGLAPWKAEDWFNEMEGGGWLDFNHRPVANWQAVMARVKTKWEADGRPKTPPVGRSSPAGIQKQARTGDEPESNAHRILREHAAYEKSLLPPEPVREIRGMKIVTEL